MIEQIDTPRALFERTDALRLRGERIGLVPTMGALHDGHLSLIDAVRAAGATRVVVSIFVNPLQFGPNEDLAKYPRTLASDLAGCEQRGVDFAYTPTPAAMYPAGFQTHVEVEQISLEHEGPIRPGHFRGVATVVTKLLMATGPCMAAFGRKDYQQLQVVTRMVRDLDLPVQILPCPTLRETDGLAMSSRNRYLSPEQRVKASSIYRGMQAASAAFASGERKPGALLALARAPITAHFDSCDYITIADAHTLAAADTHAPEDSVMLVAARLGSTRLIDNCVLGRECLDVRHTTAS
ncbi:MAG TPA: pantoate--beta-alanine ligase [Polyangiales bacterium]|nr:pantoate--beta-alanine ligase [Polyangiales bacterium]